MMTGKNNSGYAGKYTRKPRFSGKSLALLVSALVLTFSVVGGTLAWLSTDSGPVTNTLNMPKVDLEIQEDFDGRVKKDVRIKNESEIPVYVRATVSPSYQPDREDQPGEVLFTQDNQIAPLLIGNMENWVHLNGVYYYTLPLASGESTANLADEIRPNPDFTPPDGYTFHVRILAECIQAQGMKDGVPMVEAQGWPVKVQPDGSLKVG